MKPLSKQERKVFEYLRRADGIPISSRELAQYLRTTPESIQDHALRNLKTKVKPEFEIFHRPRIGYLIKQHLPLEDEIPLLASGR